jgi:hypothetical protein
MFLFQCNAVYGREITISVTEKQICCHNALELYAHAIPLKFMHLF